MIEQSSEIKDLAAALCKAQATVKHAAKDSENPYFSSRYADLASVWEACRAALTENGLSVVQFPGYANGVATLDTMLLHSSGQWLRATAGAPVAKQDAQGVGSALTYLRRYALAAVASVAPEDDDGNAASQRGTKAAPKRQAPPAPEREPLDEKPRALQQPEPPIPQTGPGGGASWKGKPLLDFKSDELVQLRAFCLKKDAQKYGKLVEAMDEILASRQGE